MSAKLPAKKSLAPSPRGKAFLSLLLVAIATAAACNPGAAPLEPIAAPDAPVVESVALAEGGPPGGKPSGGEHVVIRGKNFPGKDNVRVLFGHRKREDLLEKPASTATELHVLTPEKLPPGETLAVAVEKLSEQDDEGNQKVLGRGVLPDAWPVGGLGSRLVVLIGCAIGIYALLGGPLFVVLASVTLLGIYAKGQGEAGFGFLTLLDSHGERVSGRATELFLPWCGKTAESPLFIAIPLFTFAGTIMAESKTPERLVNLARALLGWLPGGVALVALVACSAFTAFTGASGVTIIALGGLLYPVLRREGYDDRFSLGLLTTCGSLGLLFPPSLPVIIYGLIAAIDIDRLFTAAILPGVVLVLLLALYSSRAALKSGVPRKTFTGSELLRAFRAAFWELPLGPIVIGGIYRGWITAAEASAVTAFYALIVQVFVYRDIKLHDVPRVIRSSMVLVGAILMILGMALGMMQWLTNQQVPQAILALMEARVHDRIMFLLMLNVFILIVGCFMEGYSATLVVVPLVAPIARNYGVDSYHLGVIFLLNLEIAYSLPPVGFNLFLSALRFGKPVVSLYKAAMDFVLVMLVALLFVTYYPPLSLCLFDVPGISIEGPKEVDVKKGEEKTIKAQVTIGGVDLAKAKEEAGKARKALEEAEKANGSVWADLAVREREAEDRIDKGGEGAKQARLDLSEIRAKMRPLEAAAERSKEAERRAQEIVALGAAIEWRSRQQPSLAGKGLTLSTKDLDVEGEHEITATTSDGHKHVTQERLVVRVARGKD